LIDPDDIVQSTCRRFIQAFLKGGYRRQRSAEILRILEAATENRLGEEIRQRTRFKRNVNREVSLTKLHHSLESDAAFIVHEPGPGEYVASAEKVNVFLQSLQPMERKIVDLLVLGHSLREIRASIRRSDRTVRRLLEQIRKRAKHWQKPEADFSQHEPELP
jgi:DNA-directed RNA polymerase specialized sigma24 family protein